MKALVLEKKLKLALRDIDLPTEIGPDDVKIKMHTVGICGSDIHYYKHGKIGQWEVKAPMVLGHEGAGTVIEVGENEKILSVDDRVCIEPQVADKKSKEYKAVVDMVNNMYMDSLEEENARRSQVKREGFAGYEGNMVRSFVSNATAEANLIANMKHGKNINTALIDAKKSIKIDSDGNLRDGNTIEKLSKIYNMLVSHYSANLNNKPTPYQDRLAAMNTVYMLTSSIGYHITNATQPMMVTIPKLVGDFGVANYTKALKLYYQGLKIGSEVVTFSWKNLKFQTHIDLDNLSKEHKK